MWLVQKGHAKTTVTWMTRLHSFLASFQPEEVDSPSLSQLAKQHQYDLPLCDDWGTPFEISVSVTEEGRRSYAIRSLGRDKTRGSCCAGTLPGKWDADAVLSDGKWLQVW